MAFGPYMGLAPGILMVARAFGGHTCAMPPCAMLRPGFKALMPELFWSISPGGVHVLWGMVCPFLVTLIVKPVVEVRVVSRAPTGSPAGSPTRGPRYMDLLLIVVVVVRVGLNFVVAIVVGTSVVVVA